jgi:hypothetical protein
MTYDLQKSVSHFVCSIKTTGKLVRYHDETNNGAAAQYFHHFAKLSPANGKSGLLEG